MKQGFHGDTLIHNGREFELIDQPLEAYFDLIGQRPVFSQMHEGEVIARGYRARWGIEDGWLFLLGIEGSWEDGRPLGLHQLFPFAGSKVFAAWFSGSLRGYRKDRPLPTLAEPAHARYPDIVMTVENGRNRMASVVHRMPPSIEREATEPMPSADIVELALRSSGVGHAAWSDALV